MGNNRFEIIFLEEVRLFLKSLPRQAAEKIIYNIRKVQSGVIDKELFKKLENSDVWEFRTQYNGIQYRLLAFWDTKTETLVVATHGFIKKSWKVPRKEILKAEQIMNDYFNFKKN